MRKLIFAINMTLDGFSVSWDTQIVRSVDPVKIKALKQLPGKDILLGAGAGIAQTFMQLDLIDEYRLLIQPVLLGKGKRLFIDNHKPKNLLYTGQNLLKSGVIELIYRSQNGS